MRHDGPVSTGFVGYSAARSYAVADALAELCGPTCGEVVLPRRLDWGPARAFRLDDRGDVAVMYETVLRESRGAADLGAWLDAATLLSLWPALVLPRQLRSVWETRFPELRSEVAR